MVGQKADIPVGDTTHWGAVMLQVFEQWKVVTCFENPLAPPIPFLDRSEIVQVIQQRLE